MDQEMQQLDVRTLGLMFVRYRKMLVSIVAVTCMIGVVLWLTQSTKYKAAVLMDIARIGEVPAETTDYTYDTFYRIKADEQFAETVSHWLKTPRVVEDILTAASMPTSKLSLRGRERFFAAHRISPQSISVTYVAKTPPNAEKIAVALTEQINIRVASLNHASPQEQWFVVQAEKPIVVRAEQPLSLVLIVSAVAGSVIAVIAMFVRFALAGGVLPAPQSDTSTKTKKAKRKKRKK